MQPPVAPIALDYLASSLEDSGYRVDLLDLCFSSDPLADVRSYLSSNNASVVAVTLRNTDDTTFATRDFFLPKIKELAACIRGCSEAPIVLGGSGFSVAPEAILEFCGVDLGVWGEGEYALSQLVDRIISGGDYRDIHGVVYCEGKDFHRNKPFYIDLDEWQTPRRNTIYNRRYYREGGMGGVETKRGCPKKCIYCADPLGKGRKLRMRSPSSVVDEMESLLGMVSNVSISVIASSTTPTCMPAPSAARSLIGGWARACAGTPTAARFRSMKIYAACSYSPAAPV